MYLDYAFQNLYTKPFLRVTINMSSFNMSLIVTSFFSEVSIGFIYAINIFLIWKNYLMQNFSVSLSSIGNRKFILLSVAILS